MPSKREVKRLLKECVNGEVSYNSVVECKRIFQDIMYLLGGVIKAEFEEHNELRSMHGLPPLKRLKEEIVQSAWENLYLSVSHNPYKSLSGVKDGDAGESNNDTVSSEAIEVSYA
jgi:hypothetical protein